MRDVTTVILAGVALWACTGRSTSRPPPAATAPAETSEPAEVAPAEPEIPGPATPEACEAEASRQGLTPGCRYEVIEQHPCGGPPVPPGFGVQRVCLCHECTVDADCGGEQRCVSVPSLSVCNPYPRRLCVAPDEPCFPGTSCPGGLSCGEIGYGEPGCGTMRPGPP